MNLCRQRFLPALGVALTLFAITHHLHAAEVPDPSKTNRAAIVAKVGPGSVTLGQVLSLWGPSWHEVRAQVLAGKLPAAQADAKLQKAWTKAMEDQIRDEIFFQEAQTNAEAEFQRVVDQYAQLEARTQGPRMMRSAIERKLRAQQNEMINAAVDRMIEKQIQAAGGFESLRKVLDQRGIGFHAWKAELVRKGRTMQYLFNRIDPFGEFKPRPKDVLSYYRENPEEFTIPGDVVFRHILFSNEKRGGEDAAYNAAASVWEAISQKRITFAEAAQKHSDDPLSAARGGLEQNISTDPAREAWLDEVRTALREDTPGVLSPILLSTRGAHLAVLIDAKPGKKVPFKIAQDAIIEKMRSKRWEARTDELYVRLRKRIPIQIQMKRFPQNFSLATPPKGMLPTRRIGVGSESVEESDQGRPRAVSP